MDNRILVDYIDRIYGYALNRTFSREEADELSQEILFTTIRQLHSLNSEESFEPWLWGVADNVTKVYRRKHGKQRAMYSYNCLDTVEHIDDYPFEETQIYDQVRTKIAMLSSIYRDIIILHYYDNLSCKEISEKLCIPEGTVTWRLSEGRKKLKKECSNMMETALRPVKMNIRINGDGDYNGRDIPYPWMFISDALSQNILYHSYIEPKSIEELASLCGVPAFYIEDAIQNLLFREAVVEPSKGKYQTNFIIYGAEIGLYSKRAGVYIDEIAGDFISVLKDFTGAVLETGINTAEKPEYELCYLFGILALEHLNTLYNPIKYMPHQVRYDGHRWAYHAHLLGVPADNASGIGIEKCFNEGSEGKLAHYSYTFGGFSYRPLMTNTSVNICEKTLCGEDCSQKEQLANLIKDGYIIRNSNGEIIVSIPFFNLEQKHKFDELAEKYFADIMPRYVNAVENYTNGYQKLFPKHLKDDALRACSFLFVGLFAKMVSLAVEQNLLNKPNENSVCDVLIQHK